MTFVYRILLYRYITPIVIVLAAEFVPSCRKTMQRLVVVQHLLVLLLGWRLHYASGEDDDKKFFYLQDPPDPDFPIKEYQGTADDKPAFLFDND